jgi:phasin family protein
MRAFCIAAKQVAFVTSSIARPSRGDIMITVPEDFTTYQKSAVENLVKFADTWSNAAEQLLDLNIKSAKAGSQEAFKQIRALAAAKDVQELFNLQSAFAQDNAEKTAGFARALYSWGTETQGEISKLVDVQMGELNRSFAAAVDKAAKAAPTGSEFAFAAVKQAVSAANQAYDAITRAGKQVAEMTETTVTATANAVSPKKKAA